MGWETRARGGQYYTRSRKVGGQVVREYVGAGLAGELAARQDAREREVRAAEAVVEQRARAQVADAEQPLTALCEVSDLLARAVLLAHGYRQHNRGEWRKRRDESRTPSEGDAAGGR